MTRLKLTRSARRGLRMCILDDGLMISSTQSIRYGFNIPPPSLSPLNRPIIYLIRIPFEYIIQLNLLVVNERVKQNENGKFILVNMV